MFPKFSKRPILEFRSHSESIIDWTLNKSWGAAKVTKMYNSMNIKKERTHRSPCVAVGRSQCKCDGKGWERRRRQDQSQPPAHAYLIGAQSAKSLSNPPTPPPHSLTFANNWDSSYKMCRSEKSPTRTRQKEDLLL